MSDLIRRSDALAACQGMDPEGDINNLPAVTVGVRKLVWQEANDGNHKKGECFSTRSPVSFAPIAAHKKHDGWWLNVDCKTYPTLDAAKAAAQADYEARILAAMEPVAAPVTQDKFSAVDHMSRVADTWMRKAEGLQREIDMLTDPATVHANMLRGTIAKPTVEQIIHLYGVDALTKALAPVIVKEAAPYMTDLMVDPETIPDMEMEYDHRAGASDDE